MKGTHCAAPDCTPPDCTPLPIYHNNSNSNSLVYPQICDFVKGQENAESALFWLERKATTKKAERKTDHFWSAYLSSTTLRVTQSKNLESSCLTKYQRFDWLRRIRITRWSGIRRWKRSVRGRTVSFSRQKIEWQVKSSLWNEFGKTNFYSWISAPIRNMHVEVQSSYSSLLFAVCVIDLSTTSLEEKILDKREHDLLTYWFVHNSHALFIFLSFCLFFFRLVDWKQKMKVFHQLLYVKYRYWRNCNIRISFGYTMSFIQNENWHSFLNF